MSFKVYNAGNMPHESVKKMSRKYTLSMRHTGRFCVNKNLVRAMSNPPGLVVLQDTQYPTDFYLKPSSNPDAFQLSKTGKGVVFLSNTMASTIAETLSLTPPYSVVFKVVKKEDGLFAINVRNPKINTNRIGGRKP